MDILAWCNKFRERSGYEPLAAMPKGLPREPAACSLALALSAPGAKVTVETDCLILHGRSLLPQVEYLPWPVVEWVASYDAGEFPELIEQPPDC